MVKAVRIHAYGGPEVLRYEDVPLASPGEGEIRIRHTAIGLNFADIHQRTGRYPLPSLPHVLGGEAAGVVEECGPGVEGVAVGDRIAYAAGGPDYAPGAYAEARLLPAERAVPLPAGIGDRLAAMVMTKGLTAQYLLKSVYPVQADEPILVHAAAGGVGSILTQWARHLGAEVIGVVGSAEKRGFALAHGCHHVIIGRDEDMAARVRALTGGAGVAAVYDSIGRDTFEASLASLRPHGTLVAFGSASGPAPPLEIFRLNRMGSLKVVSPGFYWFVRQREALLSRAFDLFAALLSGIITVEPGIAFPLADAAAAHRAMESRQLMGPAIIVP